MVDAEVEKEVTAILCDLFPDAPGDLIHYAFKNRIIDVNRCRIAVIKRYYYGMINAGKSAGEAKSYTAAKFFRSEKTIEHLIYNDFYKDIKL